MVTCNKYQTKETEWHTSTQF